MLHKKTHVSVGVGPDVVQIHDNESLIDKTGTINREQASLIPSQHESSVKEVSLNQQDHKKQSNMSNEEIVQQKRALVEDFVASYDDGSVDLAYPEHLEYESSTECYPRSYYTLSGKERLLLLFGENFRRQFHGLYPNRRPLVLAVKNECEVQKLVCTTIRPTAFLFHPLISSLKGCASFVADFIEYQSLESPGALVSV